MGRPLEQPRPVPPGRFALTDYMEFEAPITLPRLRELESALRQVKDDLEGALRGASLLSVVLFRQATARASQAYLTKAPAAMVAAVPEIAYLIADEGSASPPADSEGEVSLHRRSGGDGRLLNAADRKRGRAAGRRSDDVLSFGYGYKTEDVGHLGPFDILATNDSEEVHVEVKGTTGVATTVELTAGEVKQTLGPWISALIVVDEIILQHDRSGKPSASGGSLHEWWDWQPDDWALTQLSIGTCFRPGKRFEYTWNDGARRRIQKCLGCSQRLACVATASRRSTGT